MKMTIDDYLPAAVEQSLKDMALDVHVARLVRAIAFQAYHLGVADGIGRAIERIDATLGKDPDVRHIEDAN